MKIGVVHSFYASATPSGENVVVEQQIEALRAAGHDVHLISVSTDALATQRGYAAKTAANIMTGRGLSPLDQLESFKPDVVHVHNLFPNWSTRWLDLWTGPLVATLHNYRPVCAAGVLFRDGHDCTLCPTRGSHHAIAHKCYRGSRTASIPMAIRTRGGVRRDPLIQRADRLIVISSRAAEAYTSFGMDDRARLIPNFALAAGFDPTAEPGESWAYIGRLTPEKGILELIDHWPLHHFLTIYGEGPELAAVEARTRPNVRYAGRIPRADIPNALASSRGLVFSSLWREGAALTYIEALAAGRPIVAKAGNGAADDVAEAGSGVVFDSFADLGTALDAALADATHLGQAARRRYESTYSVDTWVSAIEAVYAEVAS